LPGHAACAYNGWVQRYSGRALRVYLVDDHDIVRRGLRDLLAPSRDIIVVGEAATAAEAVRDITAQEPDMMLLDLQLQESTGISVCRQVQAEKPRIKGLLLTASGEDEAMVATVLAGAAGYLIKVSSSQVVLAAIRKVGDGGTLLEPTEREQLVESLRDIADRPGGPLSRADRQVLQGIVDGRNDTEIMRRLRLSRPELDHHLALVIEHLIGVPSTPRHRRSR
jgi:two-component system, NarL family, response regulator DevR